MAGFRNAHDLAIEDDSVFQPYSDKEWKHTESRFGGALESVAGTAFIMLLIFVVMVWVVSHSRVFLLLPH